jgi:hypothetical protein
VLRLLARAVGEADDREGRHTALEVRLDVDPTRLEPDEGVGDGAGEHAFTLRREFARPGAASVPKA